MMRFEGYEYYGIDKEWKVELLESLSNYHDINIVYNGSKQLVCNKNDIWFLIINNGGELRIEILNHAISSEIPYCGSHPSVWSADPVELSADIMTTFEGLLKKI